MKKIKVFLIVSLSALINVYAYAQNASSDKCVSKGKTIVDIYYGYPYLHGSFRRADSTTAITNAKVTNTNHIGGKIEYMLTDRFGIGLDYTYAMASQSYNDTYKVITNKDTVVNKGSYNASITKQRILLRFNFHFATSATFDSYTTLDVGYKEAIFRTNNPKDVSLNNKDLSITGLALRVGIGTRIFFSDHIGMNIEAGIGGPIIQGGISYKF